MEQIQIQNLAVASSDNSVENTESTDEVGQPKIQQLDEKLIDGLLKRKRYYSDAVTFVQQLIKALPIVTSMHWSSTKSDVLEAIDFFVEAARHSLPEVQVCQSDEVIILLILG